MEKNSSAFVKTFPITWIFTLIVAAILWIVIDKSWALSFVLGSVTTLMMMSMLYKSSKKVLEQNEKNARRMAIRNYVFRFIFYAIILVIAAVTPGFEVIGVAIGLFTFKICLYISLFLEKRGERK